jgi:hypothetical protein
MVVMHYMLYYFNLIFYFNPITKLKKGLISYYKINEISYLIKHVDVNHSWF